MGGRSPAFSPMLGAALEQTGGVPPAGDSFYHSRQVLSPTRKDVVDSHVATSEAVLQRLLPALSSIVEEAVATAMARVLQERGMVRQGETELGALQADKLVSVDWTFTNSGEPWPMGAKLRFLRGSLAPPPTFVEASSKEVTPTGGHITVEAVMRAPHEVGPCEGCWQLEDKEGNPLSSQLVVRGVVVGRALTAEAQVAPPTAPAPVLADKQPATVKRSFGTPSNPQPQVLPKQSSWSKQTTPPVGWASQGPPGSQDWPRKFEDFFGLEACSRLLQPDGGADREMHRLMNKMWEYMKSKNLQGSGDILQLDDVLFRVLSNSLKVGTRQIRSSDVLPVLQHTVKKYLQSKQVAL